MNGLPGIYKLLDKDIRQKNIQALRHRLRGAYWTLAHPKMPDPVFILGCSRSGTTVTFETIASSSELINIGYEVPQLWHKLCGPKHLAWHSEAASAEHAIASHRNDFFRFFYERIGAGRILDKTCINMLRIPYLYALFPQAHFIYIYRDGRANVSSLMDGWRNDGHFGLKQFLGDFPENVSIDGGRFKEWSFFLPPGWRDYNNAPLEQVCAYQWVKANEMALAARDDIPAAQWTELRYEDLLDNPVQTFRNIFERLQLTFDQRIEGRCATLANRPTSMVSGKPEREKWKKRNYEAIDSIRDTISPLMSRLGYEH